MRRTQLYITGLSAYRAIDKLAKNGVPVLSAKKAQKNAVEIEVDSKDAEKAFAILRDSCYNVEKVRYRGLTRMAKACLRRAGLVAGAALFLLAVPLTERRVLRIEVVGSGDYYGAEVREILLRGGVDVFSKSPSETSLLTAEILSLPRVSFCSIKTDGGILTVEVEVSDDAAVIESRPLLAPRAGTLAELVCVRGTPLAAVGQEVSEGQILIANGEGERCVLVIARAVITFPFSQEYICESEEQALLQAALECDVREAKAEKTEEGYLVTGTGRVTVAVNLG